MNWRTSPNINMSHVKQPLVLEVLIEKINVFAVLNDKNHKLSENMNEEDPTDLSLV